MPLIRINRHPTRRQLFVFAVAWLALGALLGLRLWRHAHGQAAATIWIAAGGIPLVGAINRELLRGVYLGLSYATYPIGSAVACAFLAVVYFLVLTPIGLAARLFGHDPLHRRFDGNVPTYWNKRPTSKSVESYFRQN